MYSMCVGVPKQIQGVIRITVVFLDVVKFLDCQLEGCEFISHHCQAATRGPIDNERLYLLTEWNEC